MQSEVRTPMKLLSGLLLLTSGALCRAACVPTGLATPAPRDPVAQVLARQAKCPKSAMEFGVALKRLGARLEPTMVNFRGFHNAGAASAYFIFEIASGGSRALTIARGDLLFGHFTDATSDGKLVSHQGGLTIELIAWDPDKQFFNFYELRNSTWFYRGDSKDILDDIVLVHRERTDDPFGTQLRCSGCHVNGGLLQKELTAPHNDWFVKTRKLPMGSIKPDAFVAAKLADTVDAGELTKLVTTSIRRLADSPGYRKVMAARGMQEQLRPLFCPLEVNIESDTEPFDDRKPVLHIPSAFFADPRLGAVDISVQRQHYDAALLELGSRLPRTPGRADADHAWLAPVKAQSDMVAVEALIERGIVDKEFVADVLAVDFTNPVFSKTRCGLLKVVPEQGGPEFVGRFQSALRGANAVGAVELLGNLSDPARNAAFFKGQAEAFLAKCRERAADPGAVLEWTRLLAQRRAEVSASEISRNPKGHILEDPGRIVFPSIQPAAEAGRLALTAACQVQ